MEQGTFARRKRKERGEGVEGLIECIGSVNFLARIEGINSNGISREDRFVWVFW